MFNFTVREFILGSGTGTPTLQFYKKGFVLNSNGESPSWQDVILSGNTALTLVNAKANSLNYVKLFGATEQNGTPSPDTPMDIVSNNGVVKFSPNLFNKNDSDLGDGYILALTGEIAGTSRGHTGYFKVIPNTTYYVTLPTYQTGSVNGIAFYNSSKTYISGFTSNKSYGSEPHTFTVPSDNSIVYARLTLTENIANTNLNEIQIEKGSTGTPIIPYGTIYTDGTQETVGIDTTGGSATAEMLLKVGTYQDEQSVIDGGVTRNVGIKVLDGTEKWEMGSALPTFAILIPEAQGRLTAVPCTNFSGYSGGWSNMPNNSVMLHATRLGFRCDSITSLEDWRTYLADQYNAGTPVIIVYPLAEPTTETVTPQPLSIQAGTNIITAEGSIDNLGLEVSYKATV